MAEATVVISDDGTVHSFVGSSPNRNFISGSTCAAHVALSSREGEGATWHDPHCRFASDSSRLVTPHAIKMLARKSRSRERRTRNVLRRLKRCLFETPEP